MSKPISRTVMLNVTIVVEALLLLAAAGWSKLAGLQLIKAFHFDYKLVLLGIASGMLMAGTGYACYALGKSFKPFAQVKEIVEDLLIPLVAELRPMDLFVIAALSGFCEEVFFRGVVQPQFGLVITSLAFGLFHDPSFKYISYAVITFLYALLLGTLYLYTGSLWVPIFAHLTHNLISLYVVRYKIKPPASPVQS